VLNNSRITVASLAIITLTLASLAGVGVRPASAATVEVTVSNITYSANDTAPSSGATVTGYSGDGGEVTISPIVTIGGEEYAVTAIGHDVFSRKPLTKVTLPNSVITIGDFAFFANQLASVVLPNALTAIGKYAFYGSRLESLEIPNSVNSIGIRAFMRNQLTTVTIGNSVATIGTSAFNENSIASLTIPDSVTAIGDSAFGFNPLTSLSLGKGLVTIGDFAFASEVNPDIFDGITTVTIPNSVTSIGTRAFAFHKITSLTLGENVTGIDDGAFFYNSLTSVRLPASVTSIGADAFARRTSEPAIFTFLGGAPTVGDSVLGNNATATVRYTAPYLDDFGSLWNGYTAAVADIFPVSTTPTVVGVAKVGLTLTAHAGTWSPEPALSYVWKQVGSTTVLGRAATYVPVATDLSHALTVTVTAHTSDRAQVLSSVATLGVVAGTFTAPSTPLISGTTQVGKTLTVDSGDWPENPTLTYVWKWSGTTNIVGTDASYTPSANDVGKKLTVSVIASLPGFTEATVTSAQTAAISSRTFTLAPTPTISGTKAIGETLTAIAGTWTAGATLAYAWTRSGSASTIGTDARYTLAAADVGKTLSVTVTATRSGFTTLSKPSVATATILGFAFTNAPVPTITGTKKSGSTLTAVTTGWAPSSEVTFTYVWKRASTSAGTKTTITGATSKTYRLVTADKGRYITVTVTANKTGYTRTATTSANGGTKIAS